MKNKDRVVVIAGATGGLGQVVTQAFVDQDVRLVLLGRNAESLKVLTRELDLKPGRHMIYAGDMRDPESVQLAANKVISEYGRVDVLLNLVGGWVGGKTVVHTQATELENMLDQHLWTTYYLAQAFTPKLIANEWGRIIVVSSPFAANPRPKGASYAVGKAAQEALLMTLAQELKGTGVTANTLLVATIDVKHARDKQPTEKNSNWTIPEEIIAAILYLCSDEAKVVNGARIPLYGAK